MAKENRGVAIALTLPEENESKIRDRVFNQIKLDDLKKETGFETLIAFLDKHLAKGGLADSFTKFEEFEDYRRNKTNALMITLVCLMLTIVESRNKV